MNAISKEEEYQYIKELLENEEKLRFIKKVLLDGLPQVNKNKIEVEIDLKAYEKKSDDINSILLNVEFSNASNEIVRILIQKFNEMKAIILAYSYGLPISSNHGTMFQNYFIGKIVFEIKNVVTGNFLSISRPFIYPPTDSKKQLDSSDVIKFFEEEIKILNSLNPKNYHVVMSYYDDFVKRITIQFSK